VVLLASDHPAQAPNETRAYAGLQALMRSHGPEVLDEALTIVRAAWPSDHHALFVDILNAVTVFVHLYREHPLYNATHFVIALEKVPPVTVLQRFRQATGLGLGGNANVSRGAHLRVLLALYNWRLSRRSLPEVTGAQITACLRDGKEIW
jgi:hypothetical protein